MDLIATAEEAARFLYATDQPTKSQSNMVRRKCQDGTYRHAAKDGRRWLINLSREFPELFGEK